MTTFSKSILLSVCCLIFTTNADLLSPANKFQLSGTILDSMRAVLRDTATVPFFGLPNSFDRPPWAHLATLRTGSQKLSAGINLTAMLDFRNNESRDNYFAALRLDYQSPYLDAAVAFDLHTGNMFAKKNLADSINDVVTEQLFTGYNHIEGSKPKDFNFLQGYLKFKYQTLSLLTGRYKLRLGPGYKGTLSLSGTGVAPFYYYLLQLNLGSLATMSCYLNGLDDDYLFPDTQNLTTTTRERFSAGQRIDVRLGRHVQLGIYEIVDFHGSRLLPRYANPLQIYYLGNVTGGAGGNDGSGESSSNIMGGGDLQVLFPNWRAYLDFLNDDITMFATDYAPNKFAFQLGGAWYPTGIIKEVGAEYTHVSFGVYTHHYPGLGRHVYMNEPRGWPWGPDQDWWHVRARAELFKNLTIYAEANYVVKGANRITDYHWDYDAATLRELDLKNTGNFVDYVNDPQILSFTLQAQWQAHKQVSIGAIYRPAISMSSYETIQFAKLYGILDIPGDFVFKL